MMLPGSSPSPTQSQPIPRIFNHAGVIALAAVLVLVGYLAWPLLQVEVRAGDQREDEEAASPARTATRVLKPTAGPPGIASLLTDDPPATDPAPGLETPLDQGLFILSLDEGGYSHLFAYHPLNLPFTRLTIGPWDDTAPAISPDGSRLAFASNRDGQWDLYLLDLASGAITRLTHTLAYDGAPAWSPDGRFLAYESYTDNLEIFVRPISGDQEASSLSDHPKADFSPSWSPNGKQVAFVSTRSGEREIWLANLDSSGPQRFTNLSQNPQSAEAHPAWSKNGSLSWAALDGGDHSLMVWEGAGEPRRIGSGSWPAWSPDGRALLTLLLEPNRTWLTAYNVGEATLALPPVSIQRSLDGLAWAPDGLPVPLAEPFVRAASETPAAPWEPSLSPLPDIPAGRHHLVPLDEVVAPYPQLHDMADEAFQTVRSRLASEAGWDLLATLENAFVPLTAPLPPGMGDDWLYTGRAFALSPLPADAGWLAIVPQEFGGQMYWQVYARARHQDGSQGMPLYDPPWDFNARYSGDLQLFQQGGAQTTPIPAGYWIDVTRLVLAHGWERLPALSIWRTSYPAARFNEFVLSGSLEWYSAMLELYPAEALVTPTPLVPPTLTPTPTSAWLSNLSHNATATPPGFSLPSTPGP